MTTPIASSTPTPPPTATSAAAGNAAVEQQFEMLMGQNMMLRMQASQQAMNKSVMSIENPHYAPTIQVVPQHAPAAFPEAVQPKSDAAPAQPAKVPDVVKSDAKPRGPITIENPYFRESAQFIKKGDNAVASDKH